MSLERTVFFSRSRITFQSSQNLSYLKTFIRCTKISIETWWTIGNLKLTHHKKHQRHHSPTQFRLSWNKLNFIWYLTRVISSLFFKTYLQFYSMKRRNYTNNYKTQSNNLFNSKVKASTFRNRVLVPDHMSYLYNIEMTKSFFSPKWHSTKCEMFVCS